MENLAFIDGQNLYMGTKSCCIPWKINLYKFKIYLERKYDIEKAYYFIGYIQEENHKLYEEIQNAGFILVFKEHNPAMLGKKKGNVDTDIVFEILKNFIENKKLEKMMIISGDGDYKKTVDYLISKDKFSRILFPNGRYASSLYNSLDNRYKLAIDRPTVRQFIECKSFRNEKGAS